MTETPPPSKITVMLERYGPAAAVTFLGLLALEMIVLTPMVHYGIDLSGLFTWMYNTFGWQLESDSEAGKSWFISMGIAYAITRPLKPIQIAVALPLIPLVAKLMGHTDEEVAEIVGPDETSGPQA